MRARERTRANASTTPTRRKHAKQTRIHAFRAKHRAFLSSKALHNSTPFRGNLPSHTQEGLGFTRGKKCLGFARRERRRERFFGVDDRSSRGIRIISRELDRRSIERDVKGKRERERDVPIVYRFWTACFFCRKFCALGAGPFFSFFFPPSPSPLVSSFAAKNTRES